MWISNIWNSRHVQSFEKHERSEATQRFADLRAKKDTNKLQSVSTSLMISSEDRNMRKLVRTDEIFGQSQLARRVSKSAGVLKPQKSGLAADKLDLFEKRLPFFAVVFSVLRISDYIH